MTLAVGSSGPNAMIGTATEPGLTTPAFFWVNCVYQCHAAQSVNVKQRRRRSVPEHVCESPVLALIFAWH